MLILPSFLMPSRNRTCNTARAPQRVKQSRFRYYATASGSRNAIFHETTRTSFVLASFARLIPRRQGQGTEQEPFRHKVYGRTERQHWAILSRDASPGHLSSEGKSAHDPKRHSGLWSLPKQPKAVIRTGLLHTLPNPHSERIRQSLPNLHLWLANGSIGSVRRT
jgi:hypothetical protein